MLLLSVAGHVKANEMPRGALTTIALCVRRNSVYSLYCVYVPPRRKKTLILPPLPCNMMYAMHVICGTESYTHSPIYKIPHMRSI